MLQQACLDYQQVVEKQGQLIDRLISQLDKVITEQEITQDNVSRSIKLINELILMVKTTLGGKC